MNAKQPTPLSRRAKIIVISQAHLAPDMSLARWQDILAQHGVIVSKGANGDPWRNVSDETIGAILAEITAIVEQALADKEVQP